MSEVRKSCTYSSQMRLLGETPYMYYWSYRKCSIGVMSEEMKTPDCLTAKLDILLEHLALCTTDDSWFQHQAANLEIILRYFEL